MYNTVSSHRKCIYLRMKQKVEKLNTTRESIDMVCKGHRCNQSGSRAKIYEVQKRGERVAGIPASDTIDPDSIITIKLVLRESLVKETGCESHKIYYSLRAKIELRLHAQI